MSKTNDSLKKIEQQRTGKYSSALNKEAQETAQPQPSQNKESIKQGVSSSQVPTEQPRPISNKPLDASVINQRSSSDKQNKEQNKNPASTVQNKQRAVSKIWLVFTLIILAVLGLNLKLFLELKRNTAERRDISMILKDTQESLKKNMDFLTSISTGLEKLGNNLEILNIKIQNDSKKIAELNAQTEAQSAAFENLVKAKNTLFNRVSELEVEMDKLKSETDKQ